MTMSCVSYHLGSPSAVVTTIEKVRPSPALFAVARAFELLVYFTNQSDPIMGMPA